MTTDQGHRLKPGKPIGQTSLPVSGNKAKGHKRNMTGKRNKAIAPRRIYLIENMMKVETRKEVSA